MRYDRIDGLRPEYPVRMLCRLLNVSEAGYYAWRRRPPSPRAQENARLSIEIKLAHERTRQTYGPERLQAELADHGIHAGIDRIKRIRRELGLRCRQKRKFKVTTDSRHHLPIAPNLLDRQFAVSAPNRVWVTDITYVATDEGWLYLAGIKDLFNGELAYSTSSPPSIPTGIPPSITTLCRPPISMPKPPPIPNKTRQPGGSRNEE